MWIDRSLTHESIAVKTSLRAPFFRATASLVLLPLLCMGLGCRKKAPPVQEQTAAVLPVSAPATAPVVVPQPTPASELPDWKPASAATSAIEIPIVKGLQVDSTITGTRGFQDHFDKIVDMNATTVTIEVQSEDAPSTNGHPMDSANPPSTGKGTIVVDVAALTSSNRYTDEVDSGTVRHYSGSTERGVSTETLNQLRTGKLVQWQAMEDFGPWVTAVQRMAAAHETVDAHSLPTRSAWGDYKVYQCNLQRVEPTDFSFPVLVNGEPVELPALHAKCVLDNGWESHFYILDQPSNPMFLYYRDGISRDSNQVFKITFDPSAERLTTAMKAGDLPSTGGGSGMEKKLADKEPVEIYGIYFDSNSSFIKPESEVVLKQIADIMRKNPTWKLSVSGHTDNVGGDDFNLKLSQARAAAVKTALVKEYKIAPDRLATGGFGASQPIADNSKVEGRARNRRVVLQRQ
jgi:outer membrane protein OmpA-like peptidoglycan-associated protein